MAELSTSRSIPEPGQVVIVRQRPFVVTGVGRSELPSPSPIGDARLAQHLVSLSSVEDEGLGEELNVVWELEPGAICLEKSQLPPLESFDPPRHLDAFLDAVNWGCVSQADDKSLQAPFRSGVEIDDYQLDPVVRALSMPRVNLLIADDVGLGKTIEAGLVVQELILRHRVRTVLIVCPSSIQIQWSEEMRDKFGLEFRIVDSDSLRDLRRRRGLHVNPWTHFPRLITSIDFLKRDRPLRLFRETLPSGDEPTFPRRYDLVIVDEAHNVAPSGRGKYALDSMRTTAVRTIAPHFEHRLFLTATPHNGYSESFTALLHLLDDQRFVRRVKPNRAQLEAVMVRRMKSELERRWDGSRRFAQRSVKHLEVQYTEKERAAHKALQRYAELRTTTGTPAERFANEFVLKLLKKRLFSSPAAFAKTLGVHARSVGGTAQNSGGTSWRRRVEEVDNDFWNDEERDETEDSAVEIASHHSRPAGEEEKRLLKDLQDYALSASNRADSKYHALVAWLNEHIRPSGNWSQNRVIIFTEYRDTQKWLHNLLAAEGLVANDRLAMIYGGMKLEDRERVKNAFQTDPKDSPVRILLATDAASEGLNLQNHCWQLIHYEIPWNPNRMEQRNGRVDRHGQKNDEVHVFHFVGAGFDQTRLGGSPGDLEGDLEFLYRAVHKVEAIREDLGKVGPVIAAQVEEAMLGRRRELDTARAEREAEPVRRMLKFDRKLREQMKKLSDQLDDTQRSLRLSAENIQNVVEVGLQLAGQPPLRSVEVSGNGRAASAKESPLHAFQLPALTGSWSLCAAGIPHPHSQKMRPLVFKQELAAGREDVVLCHLNHRLVQMCLRLLRAEIWSQGLVKKLHRFTARMVPDHVLRVPAVIAHGRLLVLGGDSQRIHEEIILAGGTIKEGRFARMNVNETQSVYASATEEIAPDSVLAALKAVWPKVSSPLLQSLDARMAERTKNLQKFLDDRAEREIGNFTTIMRELEKSIRETLSEKDDPQLLFDWTDDEKGQRERDIGEMRTRLEEIPAELAREVDHLRKRYRDPQARLFPIAVTFLVPPTAVVQLRQGGVR